MEVWENEKCCGNTSRRRVFPQLFRVLPNVHECFYNSIETRRTFFLKFFEKTQLRKKGKQLVNFDYFSVNSRAIITSTVRSSSVFSSSYRNTTFNQSARVFSWGCFLIKNNKLWKSMA